MQILNDAWKITNDADELLQTVSSAASGQHTNTNHHLKTKHYNQIIRAWNDLAQAYSSSSVHKKGIPQRATHHLEIMERRALLNGNGNEDANANANAVAPTIETYNLVLDLWSRSQKHLLSSRAESIMRRIGGSGFLDSSPSGGSSGRGASASASASGKSHASVISKTLGVEPNPETLRIMIRAWCRVANDGATSKRTIGNAAFNATGYLLRMQGMMKEDMGQGSGSGLVFEQQPTLDDYTMVFRAWAQAG